MSSPDRYAVIGHPVAHSRSPRIHALFAAQTGQSLVYERIDATPAEFAAVTRAFFAGGGRGLNVTLPHKEAASALCAHLTARARRARAVNTLKAEDGGALLGDKPEQAFFVRCDRTTMTQEDIDNGRLVMLVGVAAVKPAEFVLIRIGSSAGRQAPTP